MNGLEIVIIAYSLFEVRSRDPTRRFFRESGYDVLVGAAGRVLGTNK